MSTASGARDGSDAGLKPSQVNTRSGPFRLFETICRDLLARLRHEESGRATALAHEVRGLVAVLEKWEREPPDEDERASIMSRVLDLHRTVMDHLVDNKPPTS